MKTVTKMYEKHCAHFKWDLGAEPMPFKIWTEKYLDKDLTELVNSVIVFRDDIGTDFHVFEDNKSRLNAALAPFQSQTDGEDV